MVLICLISIFRRYAIQTRSVLFPKILVRHEKVSEAQEWYNFSLSPCFLVAKSSMFCLSVAFFIGKVMMMMVVKSLNATLPFRRLNSETSFISLIWKVVYICAHVFNFVCVLLDGAATKCSVENAAKFRDFAPQGRRNEASDK